MCLFFRFSRPSLTSNGFGGIQSFFFLFDGAEDEEDAWDVKER